ncbi:MAG: BON domain-containing protein [Bacillota bacterium]
MLFGTKYDDNQIKSTIENVIKDDPLIKRIDVVVTSDDGIVKLTGNISSKRRAEKLEDSIKARLDRENINYQKIINNLK